MRNEFRNLSSYFSYAFVHCYSIILLYLYCFHHYLQFVNYQYFHEIDESIEFLFQTRVEKFLSIKILICSLSEVKKWKMRRMDSSQFLQCVWPTNLCVDLTSQIGWSVMIAFNLASSLRGIVCLIYAELSNRKVNCLLQGN